MTKRRKRKRPPWLGEGVGKGHKGRSQLPDPVPCDLLPQQKQFLIEGRVEPDLKAYTLNQCTILVGSSRSGYHLSIAHPRRYPTWDEIAHARYRLLPETINVALLLPPPDKYMNVHRYCFQLWEVVNGRPYGPVVMVADEETEALEAAHEQTREDQ